MGQLINRGHIISSNDELINTLVKRGFIKTMDVEKIFRSVDRGLYITNDEKHNVYRDCAWKSDEIYLSAPFVYATVLECLELKPGNKFLNIGSGIGYFSTLAGLLLGVNGINHGIEIHQSLIDCAHQKLEEFKLNSSAIDYYHFCDPVFIQGNVCEMSPMAFYDRVYCGVNVPVEQSQFMKSLLKIGGILIMSSGGSLVKITRTDEHTWETVEVLRASFTHLVEPEDFCSIDTIKFPPVEPLSLQKLCRSSIRSLLRENLKNISPNLRICTLCPLNNALPAKNLNCDILWNQRLCSVFGVSQMGLLQLRNIIDSSAGFEDALIEDDEDEEMFISIMDNELRNENTAQSSDESTKRKSPEAGFPEQNETSTVTESLIVAENPKRMKLNKSPEKTENVPSPSPYGASDLSHTVAIGASVQEEDTDRLVPSINVDVHKDLASLIPQEFYNSLDNDDSSDESDTHSEAEKETIKYCSISNRKENELSKLLKDKINSLPIPLPLIAFLNYNLVD